MTAKKITLHEFTAVKVDIEGYKNGCMLLTGEWTHLHHSSVGINLGY